MAGGKHDRRFGHALIKDGIGLKRTFEAVRADPGLLQQGESFEDLWGQDILPAAFRHPLAGVLALQKAEQLAGRQDELAGRLPDLGHKKKQADRQNPDFNSGKTR